MPPVFNMQTFPILLFEVDGHLEAFDLVTGAKVQQIEFP